MENPLVHARGRPLQESIIHPHSYQFLPKRADSVFSGVSDPALAWTAILPTCSGIPGKDSAAPGPRAHPSAREAGGAALADIGP
jgi:hypothetical protein